MIKQKILEFALKNWKAILIVLLLAVIALKNSRDYRLMQTAYETQIESHEAQIEGLKEIHTRETKHEAHLRLRQKQNDALIQKHQYRLKQSDNKTLQVRRELSNMRREAKEMMDTLASEMKDTYLVYGHTTPGNRKV